MALFYSHICNTNERYSNTFFALHVSATNAREEERNAAIKIQSWFRSLKVQRHIKFLHNCAITIQKSYRAYVARKLYRQLVQDLMNHLIKVFYDVMATKIQARWRGYFTRKYKADYHTRKKYLNGLVLKNAMVRLQLKEVDEINKFKKEVEIMEKEEAARLYENRKTHYLLSTKVSSGVYNSPVTQILYPEKEASLRSICPFSRLERTELEMKQKESYLRTSTGIPLDDGDDKTNDIPLPPIKGTKPQGPFRMPDEVQRQRYKELLPSLRVATDYESVEETRILLRQDEWTKQIIDEAFLPSTKRTYKYQPALHTTSSYGRLDYGTKHFRDPQKDQEIHKPFQRVVSPIPLFDQLGKTY